MYFTTAQIARAILNFSGNDARPTNGEAKIPADAGEGDYARAPTTATPNAPSTRASISAAFIPATAYIASGEA